ncbi:ethanolamine ammonia-lyase subunit EutB [Falsirhodobacter halotolerans]|uniref:ethanolamine ammonia-lyase subunit EutB n=1 Tax=Falsirhodobacter halotolerans TaxID=1146892 RepID=UPI001FD51784|nr:ethanolamine ammonia-lyase subunit EutB [Falsirhodobacter halotolerans]MCJ8141115.1 ethanolamine ammonia-lyase subunit EutB [Falsirhodobacter halotolerans]
MPTYAATAGGERFTFPSLAALMAAATPERSGDQLAGLAAASPVARVAARYALADLPLTEFLNVALIPYEMDEVTRLILDTHDAAAFVPLRALTVGGLRDWLLAAEPAQLAAVAAGLTPEMVAAVSKLMRNQDLIRVARKCEVVTRFRTTLGLRGHLSTRLQPNHPADDLRGIAVAVLDGLLQGAGDAVIGINPASDSLSNCARILHALDDLRQNFDMPAQSCVLTHVTTSLRLMNDGAPVDLVFQSIAGTQGANAGFGVDLAVLAEAADAARSLSRGTVGQNAMYFETGQGAALSAGAHHGVDQQTLEVRAYGVARAYHPLLVNTVVGFIGPEYLYDGKQIIRAGLEDHCCGKLLGLPMGVDVCYTNHVEADQDDMDTLMTLLAAGGVNFVITVPGADDVMLSYQSLAFEDIGYLREVTGLAPAPEFAAWLARMGIGDAPSLPDMARRMGIAG